MITSQAATVLAAFRHLTSIVSVMSPDRLSDVMSNLATAAGQPRSAGRHAGDADAGRSRRRRSPSSRGIAAAFDDAKVAQLLATALALEGQRLGSARDDLQHHRAGRRSQAARPDDDAQHVERDRLRQVGTVPGAVDVDGGAARLVQRRSRSCRSSIARALDGVGGRAERMAAGDLPPELPSWMETLGQDNVRALSVTLLIDLLTLERDATRAAEHRARHGSARRGSADVRRVRRCQDGDARAGRTRRAPSAIGRDACRQALDRLGESLAMRETAALLGDLDAAGAGDDSRDRRRRSARPSIEALKPVMMVEEDRRASQRAADAIVGFGGAAIQRLASLARRPTLVRPAQRRAAARPDRRRRRRVPLLQPLLRQGRSAGRARRRLGARPPSPIRRRPAPSTPSCAPPPARCGGRSSRRSSPSAILASSRCWSGSSRRASRSARITRSCSRRSTALGAGRPATTRGPGAGPRIARRGRSGARQGAGAQGAGRQRAGADRRRARRRRRSTRRPEPGDRQLKPLRDRPRAI